MPYRIYGGVRFYERLEIKNALSYAKLAIDNENDTAFERIINVPSRGIGAKTMDQIRELARENSLSLWSAAEKLSENSGPKVSNALKEFFSAIDKILHIIYIYFIN